ncbi:MAG: bifunctional DNA primase/polymerase [Alphaproteobacteria bacterium]
MFNNNGEYSDSVKSGSTYFGRISEIAYPFRDHAAQLHAAGYSPIPIIPGTKRPALLSWSDYCTSPLTLARIQDYAARHPTAALGIALGLGGVVAVDVDTVDPEQCAAINAVLPASPVVKTGAKGFTAFYRASAPITSRHFADTQRRGILDLLSVGTQTVLPPSAHPAGHNYGWLSAETLATVSVDHLPELPTNIAEQLEEALEPWCARKTDLPELRIRTGAPPVGLEQKRFKASARAGLARKAAALAEMGEGGRNNTLFALAAGLGRYVFHGILPYAALEAAALQACAANGLLKEDGRPAVLATLHKGLARAKDDPLPMLKDRTRRTAKCTR